MSDERGIGDNGGPPLSNARKFRKERWAWAIFRHPAKPLGAVALSFVLYMEMNDRGEGAAISDEDFADRCGVSQRSVRDYKSWLLKHRFVRVTVRGVRGRVTTFAAQIPEDIAGNQHEIPEKSAGNPETTTGNHCRQSDVELPAISAGNQHEIPEKSAGNSDYRQSLPAISAEKVPPSRTRGEDNNIINTNTSQRESFEDRGYGGKELLESSDDDPTPASALEAFELYNAMALRIGIPQAKTLTPQRRKAMMARMREHGGIEAWKTALANIERSNFLQGSNDRSWRADLDFLCQAKSFTRVVEGGYGNGAHAGPGNTGAAERKTDSDINREEYEKLQQERRR